MKHFIILAYLLLKASSLADQPLTTACTVNLYDEEEIKRAETNCRDIILRDIHTPAGVTLNLNLNQGTRLTFEGLITWEYHQWNGPLLNITGTDVEILGGPDHLLDARGREWWDGKGSNGGKLKPKLLVLSGLRSSLVRDITIKNPPSNAIWIEDSEGVVVQDINVDSKDGDVLKDHNTKGINILKSDNITIQRLTVYNQDDCVDIKSGTNILITEVHCSGGYGISIGSVGGSDYNIVEDVVVSNSDITNSDYGIRVKTCYEGTGLVNNVTFEDIVLTGIRKYGIVIEGDYTIDTDTPTGVASGGVPIKDLTLNNVTGTVGSSGVNIYILVEGASDWHWSDVSVTGGKGIVECGGIPEGCGITC